MIKPAHINLVLEVDLQLEMKPLWMEVDTGPQCTGVRGDLQRSSFPIVYGTITVINDQAAYTYLGEPVSNQELECRKFWKWGDSVSVGHFQYHKGSGDSSDTSCKYKNTVVISYAAKLKVVGDNLWYATIHILINLHSIELIYFRHQSCLIHTHAM